MPHNSTNALLRDPSSLEKAENILQLVARIGPATTAFWRLKLPKARSKRVPCVDVLAAEIPDWNRKGAFCGCQTKHAASVFLAENNGMGQEMTPKRNQESDHCRNFKASYTAQLRFTTHHVTIVARIEYLLGDKLSELLCFLLFVHSSRG